MDIKEITFQLAKIANETKNSKPRIVAYGLMNAGKSSLLNMLTQHIDYEYFKTNDIRETMNNLELESAEYIYIDTPGLDANEEDEIQAQIGVDVADIVLFLHQSQGELEANEVSFLKSLKKSFGAYAKTNIIIVLNKIDKEVSEKNNTIKERIREQCKETIDFSPAIFQISTTRYQVGVLKQKKGLIEASNIDTLKEHLNTIAANVSEVRAQRNSFRVDELQKIVDQVQKELLHRKKKSYEEIVSGFSSFNNQLEHLRAYINSSVSNFNNI